MRSGGLLGLVSKKDFDTRALSNRAKEALARLDSDPGPPANLDEARDAQTVELHYRRGNRRRRLKHHAVDLPEEVRLVIEELEQTGGLEPSKG